MTLIKSSSVSCIFKQFVRFKSQRRSLGKPPGVARSLDQRLQELYAKDEKVHYKVDIGFAKSTTKRKEVLAERVDLLKKNRAHLEKQARSNNLLVPLEEVKTEWNGDHVAASAAHYGIFDDLFGDAHFTPALRLDVNYPGGYPVYRGNLLTPCQAGSAPEVKYETKSNDSYWSLVLTTPDGHLSSENREYLLWFMGNIRGSNVFTGDEVASYLQPFPLFGIGACRYILVLYKQQGPIDYSSLVRPNNCSNPSERDFSTYEFYRERENSMTPAGLAFFQSEWDESVRKLFHSRFTVDEPICSYDFPQPYHPKQTWFPKGKPFNLYLDRYRDEKEIAKEYLLMKLKDYHPWHGFKPSLPYPNALPFKPDTPSWLKNEIRKQRLGRARINDY